MLLNLAVFVVIFSVATATMSSLMTHSFTKMWTKEYEIAVAASVIMSLLFTTSVVVVVALIVMRPKNFMFTLVLFMFLIGSVLKIWHALLYGTAFVTSCDDWEMPHVYVYSAIENGAREHAMISETMRVGLRNVSFYHPKTNGDAFKSIHDMDIPSDCADAILSQVTQDVRRQVYVWADMPRFLTWVRLHDPPSKFVLVMEDDTVFLHEFDARIMTALCAYSDADVIWIESRNTPQWLLTHEPSLTAEGLLINKNALEIVSSLIDVEFSIQRAKDTFRNIPTEWNFGLRDACVDGILKCAVSPVVKQADVSSLRVGGKS